MLILLLLSNAFAHGGRTNSEGCHNDNISGGYHCHNGGGSSQSARSQRTETYDSREHYASSCIDSNSEKLKDYTRLYSALDDELKIESAKVQALMDDLHLNEKLIKEIGASYESQKKSLEEAILRVDKEKDELKKQELEIKDKKIKVEKEKIALEQSLIRSKKVLYREEADDVCGKVALKLYKKFKKNPKKHSNDLASFSTKEGFNKKCESLDYSKLILPVLSDQKCGKFALQIQASYNSNKKYYGDLSVAAKHYNFNLYCPGIQYINFIEEINDSSNKE